MNAQKAFWKAIFHGLLHMLTIAVLVNTCQAHVQGDHHKRLDRSSFQASHSALINQVSSIHPPGLDRREMQTIVLTTTISTYIELGIPCDATEIPQSMSSLLTRPPPLSIPTSLGSIATGGNSLTAPDGSSPAPPQTSTLRSTSAAEKPNPSSSNSLSSSQTSSPFTTGTQSSTIGHTSTADSSSAPAVPDTSTAASRSTAEPSKPATATSTTNIPISTQSISSGTTESSVALSSSSSTRNITTVVVSSTIVVLWPGTESTSSVAVSTTSPSSKAQHTAWVTQTSQETVTEWMQPSSSSSSSSSTSSSSLPSSSSNSARTAWVTKTAKATVTEWFDPLAVAPSSSSTSTTPDGPAVVVVTASAQATVTQFHDSTQTIIVSPSSSAPASPEVHPRLSTDSNLPGPTKRIVRFSQRIWYTENKHQIMVIATYEDNHVVTVYTAPERTDLPAVLVLDDQNGNKRGSLKMTFRMGFFMIDFRSEMAGRVVEWENHWTKNEADEDAPWCETVFLKDDGKERLAREIWCYYTA
ncbi:hypothetical protein CGMCC3_g12301 [Colletotrichum fructicola]|uniref:Uncharacterized protein n=2 Tax=Colletotrichum gloeosporioides species complex TaxID=2707338 RepID=L2G0N5_COLFN|nr:uncharacterized protein CGMCC3_g12301 [Colletotrichum fructicola]KAE9571742.1 hypothetical protein CGMCC3_g12301 [Colletotrichum fructicola]KAF4424703.1 hypothetical protein CFRS1_v012838 [Colletotrichum fructicola]KAF4481856.1 hypothetical protein CGGC5_v009798 [Colletotrichum fructicola Nara gc5]